MITKKMLRDLKQETGSALKKAVITDLLSKGDAEEIESYIKDILQGGCISGTVTSLIYYSDTEAFFKKHYEEIFELAENLKEETGESVNFEFNSNNFAWFGYEETIRNIASQLEIEY